ncbi:MAG: histidine kinase [Acidobacteria bacterium]|nr:histidine kinase [Acidobacteriota bacterium]
MDHRRSPEPAPPAPGHRVGPRGRDAFLTALLVNTLVTILIAVILTLSVSDPTLSDFARLLVLTACYSYAIGFLACTSLSWVYPAVEHWVAAPRLTIVQIVLFADGCVGSVIGAWVGPRIVDLPPSIGAPPQWLDILEGGIICVFVGDVVLAYMVMRSRWEEATDRLRAQELLQTRLMKLKAEAELGALQSRIQPHFLFNTLNSIAELVRESPGQAEEVIEKLSGLFRYTLASGRTATVTLDEEIRFVSDYLDIEKVRLGRRLRFEIAVDDAVRAVRLPGLLVQPLVENAVRHGISPREEGGTVSVRCGLADGLCRVEVTDDGVGPEGGSGGGAGYALENIRERLEATYPGRHRLELLRTSDGKTRALLEVPAAVNLP